MPFWKVWPADPKVTLTIANSIPQAPTPAVHRLASFLIPALDVAREAGWLLEDLPKLWAQANVSELRRLLLTMLEAVYVDSKEEKRIVAIRPKAAFQPLFTIATTKEGSGVVLVTGGTDEGDLNGAKREPQDLASETGLCLWWRRGGVDLHLKHELAVFVAA